MSYEEEDTCMSYEEEDTCLGTTSPVPRRRRPNDAIHNQIIGHLLSVKRDPISVKRDPISVKRDPISFKRDPISVKRDQMRVHKIPSYAPRPP